jgi:hypothetical protein
MSSSPTKTSRGIAAFGAALPWARASPAETASIPLSSPDPSPAEAPQESGRKRDASEANLDSTSLVNGNVEATATGRIYAEVNEYDLNSVGDLIKCVSLFGSRSTYSQASHLRVRKYGIFLVSNNLYAVFEARANFVRILCVKPQAYVDGKVVQYHLLCGDRFALRAELSMVLHLSERTAAQLRIILTCVEQSGCGVCEICTGGLVFLLDSLYVVSMDADSQTHEHILGSFNVFLN